VLLVDDGVADAHLGEIAHHGVDVRPPRRFAHAAADNVRIQLSLGDERQLRRWPYEACRERGGGERHPLIAARERRKVVDERRPQSVLREVLLHGLAAPGAFRDDRHARIGRVEKALQCDQRVVRPPVHLHRWDRRCLSRTAPRELDARE